MPTPLPTALSVEPDGRVTQGLPTEQLTTKNWLPCTGFLPTRFTITSLQLSTKEKSCSLTILILQTFTFSNSGWPIAQKNAGSLGSTGGKDGGKLRLAYGQLPATTDLKIDLQGAQTLFDMGCGPGTVSLALADKLTTIYGVDYSQGMLNVAARRAAALKADNVHWIQRAREEDWSDLPRCDIAVASRSTLVADMRRAMSKLNNQARLRVYTTHLVSTSFVSPAIQRAAGREVIELPNYIFALNVLYQMGIYAHVDFIRGQNCQQDNSTSGTF